MHARRHAAAPLALTALAALGLAAPPPAAAQNFTFVNGFAKNGNLQTNLNAQYPSSGVFTPGAFGNVPFDITGNNFNFAGITGGQTLIIPVGVFGVTDVYTLLNGFGPLNTVATVTFTGSNGATQTFSLQAGQAIRDYYKGNFANTLTPQTGIAVQNVVEVPNASSGGANTGGTPQTSTASAGSPGDYRLDAQDFTLAPAFTTQTLTSISITDTTNQSNATILSAVTVASPAPEPSQFAALGLGALSLSALALRARRRHSRT